MKNYINLLLILTTVGCVDKSINPSEFVEQRKLYSYEFDSLTQVINYELKVIDRDSVLIYSYRELSDSTKSLKFRYEKSLKRIYAGPFEFEQVLKTNHKKVSSFHYYAPTEDIIDGPGPILFNEKYGVLGHANGWGGQFYYLSDSLSGLELPIIYRKFD